MIMELALQKKAQSFRLPVELIERLKKMAKRENRSLNNFVILQKPSRQVNLSLIIR